MPRRVRERPHLSRSALVSWRRSFPKKPKNGYVWALRGASRRRPRRPVGTVLRVQVPSRRAGGCPWHQSRGISWRRSHPRCRRGVAPPTCSTSPPLARSATSSHNRARALTPVTGAALRKQISRANPVRTVASFAVEMNGLQSIESPVRTTRPLILHYAALSPLFDASYICP